MIRNLFVLSLAVVLSIAASAQTQANQFAAEKLSARELNALVASARTAAEHERIANYYAAQALEYRAEEQQHLAMLTGFMANPTVNNEKARFGTMNHCEYLARTMRQRASKAEALALEQQKLAQAASK